MLEPFDNAQLQRLSELSGVPFTTLWNIRAGETKNPRLETVRELLAQIKSIEVKAA